MTIRIWIVTLCAMLMIVFTKPASASPIDDAVSALNTGDNARVVATLKPLAERGDKDAEGFLGGLYALGRGVSQNDDLAFYWWRRAGNVPRREYEAGLICLQGIGGVRDDARALFWLRRAAEDGDGPAQFLVGTLYQNGQGAAKNLVMARHWLEKAADQGYAGAQILSAGLEGQALDYGQAYKWLGIVHSRCLLGELKPSDGETKEQYCGNFGKALLLLERKLAPGEIIESQRQAKIWLANNHPQRIAP